MHWWQNWGHALAHPADNVVAAMLVVLGVAITAATTLIVSAANRRHEDWRLIRERRYENRTECYVEASGWIEELQRFSKRIEPESATEQMYALSTRIGIYGTRDTALAFFRCAQVTFVARAANLEDQEDSDDIAKCALLAKRTFDLLVRRDVREANNRKSLMEWRWIENEVV